jgi:two-component system sensor histidine kinase/response regulator
MPDMDGLEATARIRARERQTGTHLPIIAMTAHALQGDRERCLEAGMDAYIAKPVRADELFDSIECLFVASQPAPAPPPPSPDEQDVVNWSEALRAVRNSPVLLRTIVEAAVEEVPRLMTHIREAVRDRDSRALRLAAHTLKGAIRYFGAGRIFASACRLEAMGREGCLEEAPQALAMLEAEVQRLAPVLSGYLRIDNRGPSMETGGKHGRDSP